MPINDYTKNAFLEALKNPVMLWQPASSDVTPTPEAVKVINPAIPLASFTFSYDAEACQAFATSPTLQFRSLAIDKSSDTYKEQLAFLQSLYGNPVVMEKYARGTTKTPEQTAARFDELATRWQNQFPFTAMMVYRDNQPVGMVNLGYSTEPGVAEFAAVFDPSVWNQKVATESAMLLFVVPQLLREKGYKLDATEFSGLSGPVRNDNYGSHVLNNIGMPMLGSKKVYEDQPERSMFAATLDEMNQVVTNTQQAQSAGNGTYSNLPRFTPSV